MCAHSLTVSRRVGKHVTSTVQDTGQTRDVFTSTHYLTGSSQLELQGDREGDSPMEAACMRLPSRSMVTPSH